mmetsp:Transcript_35043/g.74512  ORF Transcript_35043/g.74512 Transcript_35043/m.74512 type:complete len:366 (-) Transcript_35043:29-1126(-)
MNSIFSKLPGYQQFLVDDGPSENEEPLEPVERTPSGGLRDESRILPGCLCWSLSVAIGLPIIIFIFCTMLRAHQHRSQMLRIEDAPVAYAVYRMDDYDALATAMEVEHVWLTVPDKNANANAVFASNMFFFQKGHGGYMGTQVWREGIADEDLGFLFAGEVTFRVIFSVWDGSPSVRAQPGRRDDTSIKNCDRFGGEGAGAHCFMDYPIEEGKVVGVKMRLDVSDGTIGGAYWMGYAFDPDTKVERYMGSIFLPDLEGEKGFGNLKPVESRTAFQEYYEASGCHGQALSQVAILGPWFGDQQNPRQLSFKWAEPNYTNDCVHEEVTQCPQNLIQRERMCVQLSAGGQLDKTQGTVQALMGKNLWA